MAVGQGQRGYGCDHNNQENKNGQRGIFAMVPVISRFINMRVMRNTEVNITRVMDEKLMVMST